MIDDATEALSGTQLEYFFLEACNFELSGVAEGPFAAHCGGDALLLFGADDSNISHLSFYDEDAHFPLKVALKHAASFSVESGVVTCRIGDVTSTGQTYVEAAMRALIVLGKNSLK